ncbi:MAG: NADH-quinone oxidoreductase subunit NuoG, partial [Chloroflexi bacterium]|nr:NADH-quinone oxidoreductase subunit NuoG [Chloroflexota bacterium]
MPTLKIDDREITVDKGVTVLQAARKLGIDIPVFCYHEKLDPMGACRLCMVEMVGPRGPMLTTACTTPAGDNMVIHTQAAPAVKERQGVLEMILANHPLDCPVCDRGGECDLQDNTFRFGPGVSRFVEVKREWDDYDMGPYIARCQNRCVRCYRCVRYYDEIVGKPELGAYTRGCTMEIRTFDDRPLDFGMSGNLSEVCPVGALLDKTYLHRARPWEIRDQPTTCSHCSYGCSMRLSVRQGEIVRTKPLQNEEVNEVWLCDRGRFAHTFPRPARLNSPLIRKDGALTPVSWDEASAYVARELQAIVKANGPDAVGGISSGRPTNEDLYAFQKFMRVAVGTNNVAHRAYGLGDAFLAALGVEAATNTIVGLEKSKAFFLIGSDLVVTQPVMATRIRRAVRKGGARFIAADSRKLRYNMPQITSKLQYKPGTAPALLLSLVSVILDENLHDADATAQRIPNLDGLRQVVQDYKPDVVAETTGIEADTIRSTARLLAGSGGVTFLFGEEILESPGSARASSALAALAILTGSLGREDAGLVPLLQECNAQGANDLGVRPDMLPGYQPVADSAARERAAKVWGADVPADPGLGLLEMMAAARNGKLKALLVMGNDLVGNRVAPDVEAALG